MKTEKTYIQCMKELSPDVVYRGLLRKGFFAEKLPPIFTSEQFFDYCKRNKIIRQQTPKKCQYVTYENMGHHNVPRTLAIPSPFAYERLCYCIRENWKNLLSYFKTKTNGDNYKVSRIHVRKLQRTDVIFKMSYKTVEDRARSPVHQIKIGKRFKIISDISQCFPSIYTHSLAWAVASKKIAKKSRKAKEWYNNLDKEAQANKYGETNGLLIGPHASNILSEIVLICVDARLKQAKYDFVRSIDDYECYVETHEKAEEFIVELASALKEFNLNINRKKTRIVELPSLSDGDWTRKLRNQVAYVNLDRWGTGQISAFMDVVNELHLQENDSAVLFYALKLVSKIDLTEDARLFYVRQIFQLMVLRPYIFPKADEFLFDPFSVSINEICELSERMYEDGMRLHNYEAVAYSLFYAVKYRFELRNYDAHKICDTNDVITIVLGHYYAKARNLAEDVYQKRIKDILELNEDDDATFYQNWIHCYEFASKKQLAKKEGFRDIKTKNISFLKPITEIQVSWSEKWERRLVDWKHDWDGALCEHMIEMAQKEFKRKMPSQDCERFSRYFRCVLTNFYLGTLEPKNIIIPKSQSSYKNNCLIDSNGDRIDFCIVSWILRWLKTNCYIGERCGGEGEGATFYWVKNKLRNEFGSNVSGCACRGVAGDYKVPVVIRDGRYQEVDIGTDAVGEWYATGVEDY